MKWVVVLVLAASVPIAAQSPLAGFSLEFDPRGSDDSVHLPATMKFVLPMGPSPVRDMEWAVAGAVTSQRSERGHWVIASPDGLTVSASRPIVRRTSFGAAVTAQSALGGSGGSRHRTDLSTWFGGGMHAISAAAGLSREGEGTFPRSLSANYALTLTERLQGTADVAYRTASSQTSLEFSESVTYHLRQGLRLNASIRHGNEMAAVDTTVSVELTLW